MSSARWLPEKRIEWFERLFGLYVYGLLRSSFGGVWLRHDAKALPDSGYIGIGNHSSWWDGFIPFALHRAAHPRRPFAIMMDHEQLARFPIFRWAGAFSVDPRSPRSAKPAVDHAARLSALGCGVWIFPQDALLPPNVPLLFTGAFAHAARVGKAPVIPMAMRFVFRRKQRPEVLIDVGSALTSSSPGLTGLAQQRISASLAQIDQDIAQDAVEERYRSVVAVSKGVDERVASALRLFQKHG